MRDSVPNLARDICRFVRYCVNGKPRSFLLIESTDSTIMYIYKDRKNILKMNKEVRMLLPKKGLIQVE